MKKIMSYVLIFLLTCMIVRSPAFAVTKTRSTATKVMKTKGISESELKKKAEKIGETCRSVTNTQSNEMSCYIVAKSNNKRGYDFCSLILKDKIPGCKKVKDLSVITQFNLATSKITREPVAKFANKERRFNNNKSYTSKINWSWFIGGSSSSGRDEYGEYESHRACWFCRTTYDYSQPE